MTDKYKAESKITDTYKAKPSGYMYGDYNVSKDSDIADQTQTVHYVDHRPEDLRERLVFLLALSYDGDRTEGLIRTASRLEEYIKNGKDTKTD